MRSSVRQVVLGGFTAEAQALFGRMTTPPSEARRKIINTLIRSLKQAGIWPLLDAFQVYAAADSQAGLLDWKAPSRTPVLVGAAPPTFVADQGFTGTASGAIDTGYAPGTHGVNFTLTSMSVGIYQRLDSQNTGFEFGGRSSSSTGVAIRSRSTSDVTAIGLSNTVGNGAVANTTSTGLVSANRNVLAKDIRRNGALLEQFADGAVAALTTFNIHVLAYNQSATLTNFTSTSRQAAYWYAGGFLTLAQEALLYTAAQNYMIAVGGQV